MSFVWGVAVGVLLGGPLVLLVLAFFAGAALEPEPLIVRVATFRDDQLEDHLTDEDIDLFWRQEGQGA